MNPMLSTSTVALCLAGLVAVAAFNAWTARINQFFFFSRTAPAEFAASPAALRIAAIYRGTVWLAFLLGAALFLALASWTAISWLGCFVLALLVLCLGGWTAYARAHRQAGVALNQVSVGSPPNAPATVSVPLLEADKVAPALWRWLLAAPLAALALWTGSMLCVGMGFAAFATEIEARKASFLCGVGSGLLFAALLVGYLLRYHSRRRTAMARFEANSCLQLAWMGTAVVALGVLSAPLHYAIDQTARSGLLVCLSVYVVLRLAYAFLRARHFAPPAVERNGDEYWRWGLFYYNPSDPTLFIQRRCGPMYTVNFANFLSWPLAALFLADIVFLATARFHR